MTDIVERLRAGEDGLEYAAADEIERLREALIKIKQWAEAYELKAPYGTWDRHIAKGVGDIARAALAEAEPDDV